MVKVPESSLSDALKFCSADFNLSTNTFERGDILHRAIALEAIAVLVLVFGAVFFIGRFIKEMLQSTERPEAYRDLRQGLGRTLMLSLDLLVAADIILTVTLELSFETLGMLGLLMLIRTFLHFVLELKVTGRWSWQGSH